MKYTQAYITLGPLSERLGLPLDYLKTLAKDKLIPCLDVNGKLHFEEKLVREALHLISSPPTAEAVNVDAGWKE